MGYEVIGDLDEIKIVKENDDKKCLKPDFAAEILGQEPTMEGKIVSTPTFERRLLKVTTPDGVQAKAGIEAHCAQQGNDTAVKAACIVNEKIHREDKKCGEKLAMGEGTPSLTVWKEKGGSEGMTVKTWENDIGQQGWRTGPDGITEVGSSSPSSFDFDNSYTDECNPENYRNWMRKWMDRMIQLINSWT